MNEGELLKAIKRKLRSGYPAGELKETLVQQGYSAELIDRILYQLSNKNFERPVSRKRGAAISIWHLAGISLLILFITIISAQTFLEQYAYYILVVSLICFIIGFLTTGSKSK